MVKSTCSICNGSGERDGEYGLLSCDAPNCTAATERAALEAANKAAEPMTVYDQRWFAYGLGKAAHKQQIASIGGDAQAKAWMIWLRGPCGTFENKDDAQLELERRNKLYPDTDRKILELHAPADQGHSVALTDSQIDAIANEQEEKYGQLCDAEDIRMFARAVISAVLTKYAPVSPSTTAGVERIRITPALRRAVDMTRADLGESGSNYPFVRELLAFAESHIATIQEPKP